MPPVKPEHQQDQKNVVTTIGDKPSSDCNLLSADGISNAQPPATQAQTNDYLLSAFDKSFVGIVMVDLNGLITYTNSAFNQMLNYSNEELSSQHLFSTIYPGDVKSYEDSWNSVLTGNDLSPLNTESRYYSKSMEAVWIRNNFSILKDIDGQPVSVMIICVNIQAEKKAQEKSEEVARRFRFLADSMPQQIWTADAAGNLNYFSQAFYEYSGMTKKEVQTGSWSSIVSEEDRDQTNKLWKQSLETGEEFIVEHRLKRRDGNFKWQLSRAMAQRDNNGNIIMWLGATTNIHKQKTIEEQLEKQVLERTHDLQEANFNLKHSNQDLEQFAYIATHDLQEPLRKIRTYSSWINTRFKDQMPEEAQDYMIKIENASERMSTLIDDLLNYSLLLRPQESFEFADLNLVLNEVLKEFNGIIREKHAVINATTLPHLKAVPVQIYQLFYNLLSNALKFTLDGREPLIHITSRELTVEEIIDRHLDMDLPYAEIVFSDNGIGFHQQYAEKIFVIFQRLNNRRKFFGTGIGLALCQKIVAYHRGLIYAKGTEDVGASFYILLPL